MKILIFFVLIAILIFFILKKLSDKGNKLKAGQKWDDIVEELKRR